VGTLADRADALDAARFVGRESERAWVVAARRGDGPRILHVHGDGGVGKSALLRAIARDAEADGHPVTRVDGRAGSTGPTGLDALEVVLRDASAAGAVVVVDEVDALAVPARTLRDLLVRSLPGDALVVVAGRHRPGREWFDDGVEHLVAARLLEPLTAAESEALLAELGTTDVDDVAALVEWSGGSPLALTLAARTGAGTDGDRADVSERIVAHLAGHDLDDVDPAVLEVAALARAVDAQMLAAVLPGRPTRDALRQLRASSVTELVGARVALHALVRRAVRARPSVRRADLVVRLADHLADRIPDDPGLVVDLADLVVDPGLRAVMAGASATHVADRARPDDAATAMARWAEPGVGWGERLARWCRDAPGHVVCVRDPDGTLAGIGVAGATDVVPAWAHDTAELGPVLDHAHAAGVADDALFLHDMHLTEAEGSPVFDEARKVIVGAVAVRHGVTRRHMYFTSDTPMPADCADTFGFTELAALRRSDGQRTLCTWTTDMGADGFVGQLVLAIRAEQGVAGPVPGADAHHARAVLDALRSFPDDLALARSPLAAGRGPEHARRAVLDALDAAFGSAPADRVLRAALEHTYLDADGGPTRAMALLHVSRATLYRHLKQARARVAAQTSTPTSVRGARANPP
jgi:hypothetical protein